MFTSKNQNSAQKIENKSSQILSTLEKTLTDLEGLNQEGAQAIIDNNKIIKAKEDENESIKIIMEKGSNFITNFRNLFNKPTQENAN